MRAGRGKRIALGAMVLAVVVAAVCLAVSWENLVDRWYLRQFDSGDPAARGAVAEKLADRGSLLAMPRFLEMLASRKPGESANAFFLLQRIINKRGPAARPALARFLPETKGSHLRLLAGLTLKNFPHDPAALEALSRAMAEESLDERDNALGLLRVYREDPRPCFEPALRSPSPAVREWAAARLAAIDITSAAVR